MARYLIVGLLAGGICCGVASEAGSNPAAAPAPPSQSVKAEPIIEPEADAALRRMSAFLDRLQSFRLDVTTTDELVTKEGQKVQFMKETRLAVRRPDKLWAARTGPVARSVLRYDGSKLSVHSPDLGVYAVEQAPPNIPSMIDFARERLHIEAPAGDLLLPNTYAELTDGVSVGRYVGRERIGDVQAHHLAMTEKDVDWQIWIKDGPDPFPLRYVITTKSLTERPQFTAELRNWQPNETLSDEQFAFKPPGGAKRMPFQELQKLKRSMQREKQ